MNLFDNFKLINNEIVDTSWVKFYHALIPDEPEALRAMMRIILLLLGHCLKCSALSGCYFAKNNMPQSETSNSDGLLHDYCHCSLLPMNTITVKNDIHAYCAIEKFTEYIFSDKYEDNGKRKLFNLLGYNKSDAFELQHEFEKQAEQNYKNGNYELSMLDFYGQNINIIIKLNSKNKGIVQVVSGWKVHPLGYITCNTPMRNVIR